MPDDDNGDTVHPAWTLLGGWLAITWHTVRLILPYLLLLSCAFFVFPAH